MKITVSIISFFVSCIILIINIQRCNRNSDTSWSEANQQLFRTNLYSVAQLKIQDEDKRQAFVDCELQNMMTKYPGGLGTIPHDSMAIIGMRIGQSCMDEVNPQPSIWTKDMKDKVKSELSHSLALKYVKPKEREVVCDCYINDMENAFPYGFTDTASKSKAKLMFKQCLTMIQKKKTFSWK